MMPYPITPADVTRILSFYGISRDKLAFTITAQLRSNATEEAPRVKRMHETTIHRWERGVFIPREPVRRLLWSLANHARTESGIPPIPIEGPMPKGWPERVIRYP